MVGGILGGSGFLCEGEGGGEEWGCVGVEVVGGVEVGLYGDLVRSCRFYFDLGRNVGTDGYQLLKDGLKV